MADNDLVSIDNDESHEAVKISDHHVTRRTRFNTLISVSDESECDEDKNVNLEESFIVRPKTNKKKINRILSDSEDEVNEDENLNIAEVNIRKAIRRSIHIVAQDELLTTDDESSESDVDVPSVDKQEPENQKNNTSSSDDEENVKDHVDQSCKHLDNKKPNSTRKSRKFKNHDLHAVSESDHDDDNDNGDGQNLIDKSCDISYENKVNSSSESGLNSTNKTSKKEDSINYNDSHQSINSSSGIFSGSDNTKDEYEIIDDDSVHQDDTPEQTAKINQDKPPPTSDAQKKSAKRSLTKPTNRSEVKKEIKRLTTEIERSKIFIMQGNVELIPDRGERIRKSIEANQESLNEYKKQLEQMEDSNSSVASTDLSHNLSSDKDNSLNDITYNISSGNNSTPEANANNHLKFDRKKWLKPSENTSTGGLGKQALATFRNEQALTLKRLEDLHESLISQPNESEQVKDPKGLVIRLMPHQKHALAWLAWREKQKTPGGVLADDMGLGKTLTMISLVMKSLADDLSNDDEYDEEDEDTQNSKSQLCKYQGGTLVVCPASLVNQWKNEIDNRCKRGILTTEVYHGNNREKVLRRLACNDIVITTYNLLVRESKTNGQIFKIQWKRVILDEAHVIRNHKSQVCAAVCQLKAKKRWALTGTPIQNKELDIFAILKFLKCSPFDDIRVWKRWVENKSDVGIERLAMVMKSLMLRRTKNDLIAKGEVKSLPEKHVKIINITLSEDERLVYDKVLMYSRTIFAQFLHQRAGKIPLGVANKIKNTLNKMQYEQQHQDVQSFKILVLLLRLRQICCQPSLIYEMLDKNEVEMNEPNKDENANQPENNLVAQLKGLNMSGNTSDHSKADEEIGVYKDISERLLTSENPVFDPKRCSSKLAVILDLVRDILVKKEKLIIVSQWSTYLQIIGENLEKIPGATFESFTGAVAVKDRQEIINSFNERRNPKIMLLSLNAGGVGLNLVGANHLLLVDIHWNPQLEFQAQDRIYRIGQQKDVYIYKLICNDTIEERIQKLQEKKISLADSILSSKTKQSSKLSVQDLMLMFGFK